MVELIRPYTSRPNGKVKRSYQESRKRFFSCRNLFSPKDLAKQLTIHNRRSNNFP